MVRRYWLLLVCAAAAAAVWLASTAIALDARWYFSCGHDGIHLGGMDCLGTTPKTHSDPARAVGFVPLAAAWWLATLALVGCAVAPLVARYRRGAGAGPAAG